MTTLTIAGPRDGFAARIAGHLPFPRVTAGPGTGDGTWARLADLPGDGTLERQFERLSERTGALPEVRVTHVTGWLAAAVIAPIAVAFRTEGAVAMLDPSATWVRPDPGGWFDAVAVGEPELRPVSGSGREVAELVTELFAPIVAHVLPRSRLGRRTVWATVSDRLVQALFPQDPADPRGPAVRARLEEMLDRCGPLAQRRRWTSVALQADRTAMCPVASACCLAYKTDGAYCDRVCPKTGDEERAAQLRSFCTGG